MISIANKEVKLFNLDLPGPSIGYNSPLKRFKHAIPFFNIGFRIFDNAFGYIPFWYKQ
jgi:hypothetical protein